MDNPSSSSQSSSAPSGLTAGKAVLFGHLFITIPVLVIMLSFFFFGRAFASTLSYLLLLVGFILGWLWWSFTVPRWRRWALRNGAPADRLHKLAVATGLVWPKGWIFEKTEFKVKK
jgi:hypothetical protein